MLIYLCAGCATGFCNDNPPTLYIRWGSVADPSDSLTVTVTLAVDQDTPNGLYSIRSEETTNASNRSDHNFTVTDGVVSVPTFTIGNYGLFNPGRGATGILLWVKDAPTNAFAGITETYNYIDGGFEPDYFGRHNNPPVNYTDTLTFHLDGLSGGGGLESIQAVPEPSTWLVGALAATAAITTAARRRRRRRS
jgi:hypothetical protein